MKKINKNDICNFDIEDSFNNCRSIDPEYRKIVLKAYKNEENLDIENSDMDHAKFLTCLLIEKAKKNIRIFTGGLKETFYSDLRISKAFKKSIDRNRDIKIDIVVEKDSEDKKFLIEFKNIKNINFLKLNNKEINLHNHFLLSDEKSFRIEAPHSDKDIENNNVRGFVNFNNPKLTSDMVKLFNILIDKSTPI